MTLTQVGVAMATFAALGAAIKAGPPVWTFIRTIAALPRMIESIWSEFGRNGGSTTRDRIEQIVRHTETVVATVEAVHASTARLDATFLAHTTVDATTFGLLDRRLESIEDAVRSAADQEAAHAVEAKDAVAAKDAFCLIDQRLDIITSAIRAGTAQEAANAAERKEEYDQQTNG